MTMHTRITSAATALALAIGVFTTSAAPVRASDDAAKLLFGAAALAIIAGAVHAETRQRAAPQPQHYQPPQRAQPKPKRHHRANVLPGRCEISLRSAGKSRHGYRERCLHRAGVTHLPSQCVVGHWKGAVYGARCLGRHGYVRG